MTPAPAIALILTLAASPADPLVDATTVVDGLVLDIRYASERNIAGRPLYDDAACWLRKSVAKRLAKAQRALEREGLRLKVYDCYRPLSVQRELWKLVPTPGLVAQPTGRGSNHNRGAAVDVGVVALDGSEVPLPTDFDAFTPEAEAASPLPPAPARRNRALLQRAMREAGFTTIRREWWHFDAPEANKATPFDVPLSALRSGRVEP